MLSTGAAFKLATLATGVAAVPSDEPLPPQALSSVLSMHASMAICGRTQAVFPMVPPEAPFQICTRNARRRTGAGGVAGSGHGERRYRLTRARQWRDPGNPAVIGPCGPSDRRLCVPTFRWVCPWWREAIELLGARIARGHVHPALLFQCNAYAKEFKSLD